MDSHGISVVTVPCRGCGKGVSRAVGRPGQRADWRDHVRCESCRDEDVVGDWRRALDAKATDRLRDRIREFDAAAGYEHASLDTAQGTRWATQGRDGVGACLRQLEPPGRFGVMFMGPTGIGKTYAGFAICREVASLAGGDGVRFSTEEDLIGGDVAPWELKSRLSRWFEGASMVLIDDIGVASRSPDQVQAAWKAICGMIARHQSPLVFVGTTNRKGWDGEAGLAAWMGVQSTSRLREWTGQFSTGWEDRRTGDVHQSWKEQLTRG